MFDIAELKVCRKQVRDRTGKRKRDGSGRERSSERRRIPRFASVQYRIGARLIASFRHKVCPYHYRDQYVSCWSKSGVKSSIIHPRPLSGSWLRSRIGRSLVVHLYVSKSSVVHDAKKIINSAAMERLEAVLTHLSSRYDHVRVTVHCRPMFDGRATPGVETMSSGKVLIPD